MRHHTVTQASILDEIVDPALRALAERLLAKADIGNGCWNWTGALSAGYGILARGWKKSPYKAHRLAYELFVGPIPDGHVVRHACDNPRCINPARGWKKSPYKAHRLAYELFVGPIPDGHVVRHACDNPRCINPAHLITGTQRDNVLDAVARNRLNPKSQLNLRPGAPGYIGAGPISNKERING
ncbi:hypothetical protein [Ralstonia phage RPZH6]|nr:hypothetical protein [Ralstonia phage RPZH6]